MFVAGERKVLNGLSLRNGIHIGFLLFNDYYCIYEWETRNSLSAVARRITLESG